MTDDDRAPRAVTALVNLLDRARPADLSALAVDELVRSDISKEATIWIIDHGYTQLSDLSGRLAPLSVDDSIAGRVALSAIGFIDGNRAFVPLSRRGQIIGVLETTITDDVVLEELMPMATAITNSLLATLSISDVVDRHQGSGALSLPATIQKRNLPLNSYADHEIELGSRLEPAYDVAGDAIDYAVNPEGIHLAIFDAVGHGLRSTTLTTLALSTYRLLRRRNASLAETARAVDEVVATNGRPGDFVTGVLALIRPADNSLEYWNAGHHPPLLIRQGRHDYLSDGSMGLPFGLRNEGDGHNAFESRPGDIILLYSDGVVQARNPAKAAWGDSELASAALRWTTDGLSMSQICRAILNQVQAWTVNPLADDASIVGVRRVA
jgi:serine phosphatase RsbU (regulator of sigma subunit)